MIPDYQSIMLPLLEFISDGKEYKMRYVTDELAVKFGVTEEEQKELLPSGVAPVFYNRTAWAKTYLKKAGLIDSPKQGIVVISKRGLDVLKKKPSSINVKFLKQFSEFVEFQTSKREDEIETETNDEQSTQTPEESLETAYQKIRKSLASELINKVVELSPAFFEKLVVELLVKMGYGGSIKDAGKAMGKSGDEGIDGTIKEDKLGLDIIYIQAKRWKPGNVVGRPELQKFVGALAGQGAKKGIFITTSNFTKEAIEYTPRNETKIVLIDGHQLAQLMIDYNLGCTPQQTYEVKKIDSDYFGEE
ncbi:MAG: restriction endonuclease [Bacteroidetes bacterium]|jgi:restriction system protein|nr:restriction endonuclease [Bacteroidota bacterium]MCA6444684.1 restriction endonuclease [Bacteroidota bacterium]